MEKISIKIKKKTFSCLLAKTSEERKEGFSGEGNLPGENQCMLFVFPEKGPHRMWMAGTQSPLDIVFLDEELRVLEILRGEPESEQLLGSFDNVCYVLEFPEGTCESLGLKQGNTVNSIPEDVLEPEEQEQYGMIVLDQDGNPQMKLQGGERVFSRKSTRQMVQMALNCQSDADYKKLARLILKEVLAQDGRKSEFVKGKTKENYELEV